MYVSIYIYIYIYIYIFFFFFFFELIYLCVCVCNALNRTDASFIVKLVLKAFMARLLLPVHF